MTQRLALLAVLLLGLAACRDGAPPDDVTVTFPARADSAGGGADGTSAVDTTSADRVDAEVDLIEGALNGEVIP